MPTTTTHVAPHRVARRSTAGPLAGDVVEALRPFLDELGPETTSPDSPRAARHQAARVERACRTALEAVEQYATDHREAQVDELRQRLAGYAETLTEALAS